MQRENSRFAPHAPILFAGLGMMLAYFASASGSYRVAVLRDLCWNSACLILLGTIAGMAVWNQGSKNRSRYCLLLQVTLAMGASGLFFYEYAELDRRYMQHVKEMLERYQDSFSIRKL